MYRILLVFSLHPSETMEGVEISEAREGGSRCFTTIIVSSEIRNRTKNDNIDSDSD